MQLPLCQRIDGDLASAELVQALEKTVKKAKVMGTDDFPTKLLKLAIRIDL